VLMGGKRVDRPGSFMQPTILTDVKPDNPAFRDEFLARSRCSSGSRTKMRQ
jgi:acyl-CoA reductase-like NAD-dependent aldehyde dehydrogenase